MDGGSAQERGAVGRDAQARGSRRPRRDEAGALTRRAVGVRLAVVSSLAALFLVLVAVAPVGVVAAGQATRIPRAAPPTYQVFFGDLHDHTHFSDGQGTPEQAWAQAAAGGADFMAVTDHREGLTAAEWARTLSAADTATSPTFVAIPAFEVKPKIGHLNVYATQELPPVGLDGAALYEWIAAQGAIGEWNHPRRNSDDFDGYAYRTPARTAAIGLLEMVNLGSGWLYPDFESSYVRALDKGWRVMPAANGDIHDTSWITGYGTRTALLAPALTREALYEAMRARRGYATKRNGLLIAFTVGGAQMGSVTGRTADRLPVRVRLSWQSGADMVTIRRLEIVTNGGSVAASRAVNGSAMSWTTTVPPKAGRYYYLRVWTKGALGLPTKSAWTAPVWVQDGAAALAR